MKSRGSKCGEWASDDDTKTIGQKNKQIKNYLHGLLQMPSAFTLESSTNSLSLGNQTGNPVSLNTGKKNDEQGPVLTLCPAFDLQACKRFSRTLLSCTCHHQQLSLVWNSFSWPVKGWWWNQGAQCTSEQNRSRIFVVEDSDMFEKLLLKTEISQI